LITTGVFELLAPDDPNLFIYLRKGEHEILLVAGNFSSEERTWSVPDDLQAKDVDVLIRNSEISDSLKKTLTLPPFGAVVYKLQ